MIDHFFLFFFFCWGFGGVVVFRLRFRSVFFCVAVVWYACHPCCFLLFFFGAVVVSHPCYCHHLLFSFCGKTALCHPCCLLLYLHCHLSLALFEVVVGLVCLCQCLPLLVGAVAQEMSRRYLTYPNPFGVVFCLVVFVFFVIRIFLDLFRLVLVSFVSVAVWSEGFCHP